MTFYMIFPFFVFFLPVIIALGLFIYALIRYFGEKRTEERKNHKGLLVGSSVTFGVVAAVYAAVTILFALAIRNM